MNEVLRAISERRSTRGFTDEQLTKEELDALLKAAVEAPTARNLQYWHFSVVQDQAKLDAFNTDLTKLMTANSPRGRFADSGYHVFYHAPTVIFISIPEKSDNRFAEIDAGIAVQTLALAAQSLGLGSVILGLPRDLFYSEKAAEYRRAFDFPEGYNFAIAISIGHNTVTKEAHPIGENKISFVR